ncbi:MAG: hypothetical protein BWY98_00787 [Tenericutes bacterium ADurb.BinA155]|jgi:predicted DNA-binding protein (MmcQ/YjbR family)|nr:MAG: hypothetical protein BWY98_00787 [Tenericutes bacterium ADurb.BinA155]
MDYSRYLDQARFRSEALLAFGFQKKGEGYELTKATADGDYHFLIAIAPRLFTVNLIDNSTGDIYVPFSASYPHGEFVAKKREEASSLVNEIVSKCFESVDTKEKLHAWMGSHLACTFDNPWGEYPTYAVCRIKGEKKWFGLFMSVPYVKLGLKKPGDCNVINLKLPPEEILALIDNVHYFLAYHMNKKYWITLLLSADAPMDTYYKLSQESYDLVKKK